jgi:membrane associated rhomboid family serine protease
MFNLTPVVRTLLLVNVGVFAVQALLGYDFINWFGLRYIHAESFQPYQFVTHLFVHSGLGHLFSNMFALLIFGPMLEMDWGGRRFLFFYFFTGLGAAVLFSAINYYEIGQIQAATNAYLQDPEPSRFISYVNRFASGFAQQNTAYLREFQQDPTNATYLRETTEIVREFYSRQANIPMVGASGAVFGILMAFGLLHPNTELFLLFFPFPVKAKYFVALYGLYELYAGIHNAEGDNVAHFAHIGGMLFALILVRIWRRQRTNFY